MIAIHPHFLVDESGRPLAVQVPVDEFRSLVFAANTGAVVDEPYYFQFIRHLDWSYFDHPPMVALAGLPGLALLGDASAALGLRLGPRSSGRRVSVLGASSLPRPPESIKRPKV